jgi:hypothetical protein
MFPIRTIRSSGACCVAGPWEPVDQWTLSVDVLDSIRWRWSRELGRDKFHVVIAYGATGRGAPANPQFQSLQTVGVDQNYPGCQSKRWLLRSMDSAKGTRWDLFSVPVEVARVTEIRLHDWEPAGSGRFVDL